jgi:GNAT superfamily N-acetyltransferase
MAAVRAANRPARHWGTGARFGSGAASSQGWDAIRLRDGRRLTVRQLRDDDVDRLRRLHGRLSPTSLRRRFLAACPRPSERTLERLVDLDHRDREALVAMAGDEIVAVARYHRRPDETDAEVAVIVADDWQRRGIARALLGRLAERAREVGIDSFSGLIAGENDPARQLLRGVSPRSQRRIGSGEVTFMASLVA